jgi:hypothetical protein
MEVGWNRALGLATRRRRYNDAVSSRLAIPNPCQKRWTDLQGDGRQRYCDTCRTPVHAMELYSQQEWDQVWRESNGRVCGLLCEESPAEPRSRRAVLVGALLTAISPLLAQAGRVRIRVTDPTGAAVSAARASLLGPDNKPTRTERANEKGEIVFVDLPFGDSHFAVDCMGFQTSRLTATVKNGDEEQIETTLQVGMVGEFVTVRKEAVTIKKPEPVANGSPISSPIPSDLPTAAVPAAPPRTKPAKRRRWLIFR